jgi:hypothetical protein
MNVPHDAVHRMAEGPPNITPQLVRKWYSDASPKGGRRWPDLEEPAIVAIANACNRERHEQALRQQIASRMSEIREHMQTARTAADTLSRSLPPIIAECQNWPEGVPRPRDLSEYRRLLVAALRGIRPLTEILVGTRIPGAQRRPHVAFACRLAVHVAGWLEPHGIKAGTNLTGR